MKQAKQVPRWLKQLSLVKAELQGVRFPQTPEEGLRQCAELSALSLRLLQDKIKNRQGRADHRHAALRMQRLLARLSQADSRRISRWRRDCARSFQR